MAKACKSNMSKEFKLKSALRAYADGGTVMTAADALRNRSAQIDAAVQGKPAPREKAPPPPKQEPPKQPERVQPHPDYKPRGLLRNILGFANGGRATPPARTRENLHAVAAQAVQNRQELLDGMVSKRAYADDNEKIRGAVDSLPDNAAGNYLRGMANKRGYADNVPSWMRLFSAGGEVDGPGGPREDKVPAMLSDGEYVLPEKTVQALGGPENLDRLVLRTNGRQPGGKMIDGKLHAADGTWVDKARQGAFKIASDMQGAVDAAAPKVRSVAGGALNTAAEVAPRAWSATKGAFSAGADALRNGVRSVTPTSAGVATGNAVNATVAAGKQAAAGAAEFGNAVRGTVAGSPTATDFATRRADAAARLAGDAAGDFGPRPSYTQPTHLGQNAGYRVNQAQEALRQNALSAARAGNAPMAQQAPSGLPRGAAVSPPPGGGGGGGAGGGGRAFEWGKGVGGALRNPLARTAVGKLGGVASILPEAMDDRQMAFLDDPNVSWTDKARQIGRAGLRVAGGMAGATVGGAVGSAVPVAGTVTGIVGGGYGGTQAGNWLGEKLLGDPMDGYQGGGAGPNPQREIKERFLPSAGATAGTDRMVNNVSGLRELDNRQLAAQTPQGSPRGPGDRRYDNVIETPAGPPGSGINRLDNVPGLRSPLFTNLPRDQAIAEMQGGTVSTINMTDHLRGLARENAIRQSMVDMQDRRDAEEKAAARQRYIDYMESSAVPETNRFGQTAAERDLAMAEFRTRGMDPKQRAAEMAGAKEAVENERKTSVLRQEAANRMRTDDTNRLESENLLRGQAMRADADRLRAEVAAQGNRARAQTEAAKARFEERKYMASRDDQLTQSVRNELADRAGIHQGSTPEERQKFNATVDRTLHTMYKHGLTDLTGSERNELYELVRKAELADEDNEGLSTRIQEWIGLRRATGRSRDALAYRAQGADPGLFGDDDISDVGATDSNLAIYGNSDYLQGGNLPDIDALAAHRQRLRNGGR